MVGGVGGGVVQDSSSPQHLLESGSGWCISTATARDRRSEARFQQQVLGCSGCIMLWHVAICSQRCCGDRKHMKQRASWVWAFLTSVLSATGIAQFCLLIIKKGYHCLKQTNTHTQRKRTKRGIIHN